MTLSETGKLIAMICEIYPTWANGRNIEATVRLWQKLMADDDPEIMTNALMYFLSTDTKGFPPVPGQLKEAASKLIGGGPRGLTEGEAWAMVSKAIANGYYGAKTEFDKLPPEVQDIVGSPSMLRTWSQMDADQVQTVVASNFQRSYRVRSEQSREMARLPGSVRGLLQGIDKIGALPGVTVDG